MFILQAQPRRTFHKQPTKALAMREAPNACVVTAYKSGFISFMSMDDYNSWKAKH